MSCSRKSDSEGSHDLTAAGLQERGDQDMKKRRRQNVWFKARVAQETMKVERSVSELAAEHGVYLQAWETGSQGKAGIGAQIIFYNHLRLHAAHGGQPPSVVYFNTIETDLTPGNWTV